MKHFLSGVFAPGSFAFPLAGTAMLSLLVAVAAMLTVPGMKPGDAASMSGKPASEASPCSSASCSFWRSLPLRVGVFEVGLTLRGKQQLGSTEYQIALMFTKCSMVIFVVQAVVFSPWVKPETTRWLIAPPLTVLAAGLFRAPRASDSMLTLAVIGAVAASAGILSRI